MSQLKSRCAVLASLLLSGSLCAQQVLVVDDDGGAGVDFTSFAGAVAAAADGDILLMKDGDYSGAVIDGKGLVVAAEAGAQVSLFATAMVVRNTSPGQRVIFRGLTSSLTPWTLANAAGSVWIEDCALDMGSYAEAGTLTLDGCSQVVLTRCTITGTPVITVLIGDDHPADAVHATASTLSIHECTLTGGDGNGSPFGADAPGGDGLEIVDTAVFVAGSTLAGGDGDDKVGGAGLRVSGASVARLLDETLVAGDGSPPGVALAVASGSVAHLPGTAPTFELDSPKRQGEQVTLTLQGPAGQQAWLLKGLLPAAIVKAGWGGVVLVDPAAWVLTPLGSVPASGTLALTVTIPFLGGFEGLPIYLQGAVTAPGNVSLASGTNLLLLDPGT